MVMSRTTAVGSIVVGAIELTFAIITVICGAIAAGKLSGRAAASAGLWSLYYAVPGILIIVAGATKNTVVMAFALVCNIIAVILSAAGAIVCIVLVSIMNDLTFKDCQMDGDNCACWSSEDYEKYTFKMDCTDLDTIYNIAVTMVIVYAILAVSSLTASIYGCLGTCCAPSDPVVVVAGGMPVQGGSTVVVQSNQSSMHSYPVMAAPVAPPSYEQQYGDNKGLVNNMVI